MKKFTAIVIASLLMTGFALAGQPSEADQKWLSVVEKKVAEGQMQVSTPSEERVQLLKDWAATHGYSVEVTKSDIAYRIEVSKLLARK